jgi:TetR/AcrR family transcriptional regulator, regulator of cefoperazone and chloramphenicol sensitivity
MGDAMTDRTTTTTPERILEAAAEIFGREGFKAATIRRIADAADANVAAINYHFRDKEGLYAAVLENLFQTGFNRFPADMGLPEEPSPQDRLKAFIRGMFHRLLSRDGWAGLSGPGRLIAREFFEPTPSFEPIIEKFIRPHKKVLMEIIEELLGQSPSPQVMASCCLSVIGQCIYYVMGAPVIRKIAEHSDPSEERIEQLAEFVWQFSLGGIMRVQEILNAKTNPQA